MEKQKVRLMYGVNEKQFRLTFEKAAKMKGIQGENFLKLLESRLDNVVYRMGLATTRRAARQVVNHGHITVNGKKVDIPSYQVKAGDVIAVKEASKEHKAILESLEKVNKTVEYVEFDKNGQAKRGSTDSIEYMHAVWKKGLKPEYTKLVVI